MFTGGGDWQFKIHESRRPKVRSDKEGRPLSGDNKKIAGNAKSLNLNHCKLRDAEQFYEVTYRPLFFCEIGVYESHSFGVSSLQANLGSEQSAVFGSCCWVRSTGFAVGKTNP